MDTNRKPSNRYILALISFFTLISMVFAGAPNAAAASSAATFVGSDTVSKGNWQLKYGADGSSIASSLQNLPSYASFTPQNESSEIWAAGTTDVRGLQTPAGRIGSAWYAATVFSMDVNLTDGNSHQIALYGVDWSSRGRSETIQIVDATSGAILDSRTLSSFVNGTYLVWNIRGHVKVNVQLTGGLNVVVSGIFFGSSAAATSSASAVFLNSDTVSQGNWQSKYGSDGYSIANSSQTLPAYASFTPQNESTEIWAAGTTDVRGLQTPPSGRIGSAWYAATAFSMDVNLADGNSHQIALYGVDWSSRGRSETIQIVDATSGAILDSRTLSSFVNGTYLVWNIRGHVKVNVQLLGGLNVVTSGVFFGSAVSSPSATAPVITMQPAGQTVTAGQSATFSVADTGTAPLLYQWSKNGTPISGANSSSYMTPATAASDNGANFTVAVSNTAGIATSNAAVLKVNAPTLILTSSANSVNFGSVNVSAQSTQTVTLTNAGSGTVAISSVSCSGPGFNASGIPSGTMLAPGQSAPLTAAFSPASSGSATGSISVSSNATAATTIALSGAGAAATTHSVALSWSPSSSSVVGYNVYVSTVPGTAYAKLTASPINSLNYVDGGLQTAQNRYYVVTAVDSDNTESIFSSQVMATIP